MSALLPAAAAAVPLAGWSLHTLWMRRQLDKARRDPLTGLPTRAIFEKRAGRLLAKGPAAVVVIDLDRFKALNDTFGHAAGDAAIARTGTRLAERTLWLSARLGGDEFALVIPAAPHALRDRLARLHTHLTDPFDFDGTPVIVGASIGAVVTTPGTDLPTALRRADEAMYAAKATPAPFFITDDLHRPLCRTVNGRRAGRPGTHNPAKEETA